MKRMLHLLESKAASVLCVLFAVANRIVFTSLYSLIGTDTKLQLSFAQNFLAGKGMGVTKYFTNDLSTPVFDTHQVFPPGFTFAIIPFLKVFNGNEYTAVLAYDITVAILFVFAVRSLGKKAGLPVAFNNFLTVIAGCSQYAFFMSWSATDAIGVCLILLALSETICIISTKKNISLLRATGTGLLFFLPFFFRYMYLPIALLLPLLIVFTGFLLGIRQLKTAGIKVLVVTVLWLIAFFAFTLSTAGNAMHVTNVGRGLFINQLAECYPFLPASFINIDFGAQLVENILLIKYPEVIFFLRIVNLIFLVLLIVLLWRYIAAHKKSLFFSSHSVFIIAGSFVSLAILLLLGYLSLTYKELQWGYFRWTHVMDYRYYAFIYVFVPAFFLVWLHYYRSSIKKLFVKIFAFAGLCTLALESAHGVYYNVKIALHHKDLAYLRDSDKGYRAFPSIITQLNQQYPDHVIFVCSPDQYYLHAASQMGYKAIFDYENILKTDLKVTSKSLLLMPIHFQEVAIIKDYIENKKPELYTSAAGTTFYIDEIYPQVK